MTTLIRAWAVMLVGVALLGVLLARGPQLARADPIGAETTDPEPPGATPPIPWTQLGRSDRIDILGSDQAVDSDIPVPQALTPELLTGQLGAVVNVVDGRVDVLDGRGVVLGSIPVPANQSAVPFTIRISTAQLVDGVAKLSFVLRDNNAPESSCTKSPSLTLSQLASTYRGQSPYPSIVADYQPGYVDQFIIRTGPTPSKSQQQAVLDLVATLTQRYRALPVRFEVDTSTEPTPPGPATRRVIEVRDAAPPGLRVENPASPAAVLMITGRGDQLQQQVELFADQRIKLAQKSAAAVMTATADVPKSAKIKTFAQLGMNGQVSVLGTDTLYLGFDVSQFAVGSVQEAKLHLIAHYSPVVGGEASVVIRSGDSVLAAQRLDQSGLLDITGTIPPESIASTVGVALELRYLPNQQCAPLNNRMQFGVDPSSTVAVTPGTFNRGGFPVLPMAFTPDFDVVVDRPGHLRFAAEAVNLMGQQTAVTLQPRLTDLPAAAASGRGLLLVAPGEDLARAGLAPPILPGTGTSANIGGTPDTDVDLNGPLGIVQAFSQQGRTILTINGTDDWSQVERSFDYIRAQPSRWASLSGDVVATGPAGQAVNLTLREGGALRNEYPGNSWKWWAWLTAAATVAIVLGAAGALLWRRRLRRAKQE